MRQGFSNWIVAKGASQYRMGESLHEVPSASQHKATIYLANVGTIYIGAM